MNSIPLNKRIKFNLQVCQYNTMKTCSVDKHNYINTFQRLCPPTNRLCNVYSNSIQFSNDYFLNRTIAENYFKNVSKKEPYFGYL